MGTLLRHAGVERPHVVGHSYGGLVALAIGDGAAICSLALVEPAASGFEPPAEAEAAMAPLVSCGRTDGANAVQFFDVELPAVARWVCDLLIADHPGALADSLLSFWTSSPS